MSTTFENPGYSTGPLILTICLFCSPMAMATETDAGEAPVEPEASKALVAERLKREREVQDNRSVLVAHKRNYLLPVAYADNPNNKPFREAEPNNDEDLDNVEIQFQLSLKTEIANDVFTETDSIQIAFTLKAFWQAYNNDVSSAFRETDYEPEVFWMTPLSSPLMGSNSSFLGFGFVHQSNGRSQALSRSWNRIYANLIWEYDRLVFEFKPWLRIPEDDKDDPADADGDDNPDIEDYLGNFEFTTAYRKYDNEYSMMLRNNLDPDENRGAIQLDWTFPLNRRLRGFVRLFNGYGESLIDYDESISRIGIGIALSDSL